MSAVEGKIILVTGGNRGIGKAIVDGFLLAGARKVYVAVRTLPPKEEENTTNKVAYLQIDVTDMTSIKATVQDDVEILVNSAGILNIGPPDSIDVLQAQMDTNVYGLMRLAQVYVPILRKNQGTIVQMNSTSSLRCPQPTFAGYAASKAAAYMITQALASDATIRVHSVHPGPIATDMVDQFNARDRAEPPQQVVDAILIALADPKAPLLVYTDTLSRSIGQSYQGFATGVVEETIRKNMY